MYKPLFDWVIACPPATLFPLAVFELCFFLVMKRHLNSSSDSSSNTITTTIITNTSTTPKNNNQPPSPPPSSPPPSTPQSFDPKAQDAQRQRSHSSCSSELDNLKLILPPSAKLDTLATDQMLARFLIARNGDIFGARKMYERWASFRLEYKLDHILASEISPIVDKNIGYWHGMDNQNRPTCIVIPRRNWPRCEPYMLIRFVMRMLTIGVSQADNPKTNNPSGQLSIIYDRSGMTIRHFDHKLFGIVRKIVDMVQICYAERLGVIYILGANWFFHKMYNLVSLLLTKKTKSKIKLLKQHEELLQYFDQEMLDHVLEFVVVKD